MVENRSSFISACLQAQACKRHKLDLATFCAELYNRPIGVMYLLSSVDTQENLPAVVITRMI